MVDTFLSMLRYCIQCDIITAHSPLLSGGNIGSRSGLVYRLQGVWLYSWPNQFVFTAIQCLVCLLQTPCRTDNTLLGFPNMCSAAVQTFLQRLYTALTHVTLSSRITCRGVSGRAQQWLPLLCVCAYVRMCLCDPGQVWWLN